jgi:hypothetical protein
LLRRRIHRCASDSIMGVGHYECAIGVPLSTSTDPTANPPGGWAPE